MLALQIIYLFSIYWYFHINSLFLCKTYFKRCLINLLFSRVCQTNIGGNKMVMNPPNPGRGTKVIFSMRDVFTVDRKYAGYMFLIAANCCPTRHNQIREDNRSFLCVSG